MRGDDDGRSCSAHGVNALDGCVGVATDDEGGSGSVGGNGGDGDGGDRGGGGGTSRGDTESDGGTTSEITARAQALVAAARCRPDSSAVAGLADAYVEASGPVASWLFGSVADRPPTAGLADAGLVCTTAFEDATSGLLLSSSEVVVAQVKWPPFVLGSIVDLLASHPYAAVGSSLTGVSFGGVTKRRRFAIDLSSPVVECVEVAATADGRLIIHERRIVSTDGAPDLHEAIRWYANEGGGARPPAIDACLLQVLVRPWARVQQCAACDPAGRTVGQPCMHAVRRVRGQRLGSFGLWCRGLSTYALVGPTSFEVQLYAVADALGGRNVLMPPPADKAGPSPASAGVVAALRPVGYSYSFTQSDAAVLHFSDAARRLMLGGGDQPLADVSRLSFPALLLPTGGGTAAGPPAMPRADTELVVSAAVPGWPVALRGAHAIPPDPGGTAAELNSKWEGSTSSDQLQPYAKRQPTLAALLGWAGGSEGDSSDGAASKFETSEGDDMLDVLDLSNVGDGDATGIPGPSTSTPDVGSCGPTVNEQWDGGTGAAMYAGAAAATAPMDARLFSTGVIGSPTSKAALRAPPSVAGCSHHNLVPTTVPRPRCAAMEHGSVAASCCSAVGHGDWSVTPSVLTAVPPHAGGDRATAACDPTASVDAPALRAALLTMAAAARERLMRSPQPREPVVGCALGRDTLTGGSARVEGSDELQLPTTAPFPNRWSTAGDGERSGSAVVSLRGSGGGSTIGNGSVGASVHGSGGGGSPPSAGRSSGQPTSSPSNGDVPISTLEDPPPVPLLPPQSAPSAFIKKSSAPAAPLPPASSDTGAAAGTGAVGASAPPRRQRPRSHGCSLCSAAFVSASDLRRHVNAVHDRRRDWPCTQCAFVGLQRAHLTTHVAARHGGARRYVCTQCVGGVGHPPYRSITRSAVERHVRRVHERLRPYACSHGCGMAFAARSDLTRHIGRQHAGVERGGGGGREGALAVASPVRASGEAGRRASLDESRPPPPGNEGGGPPAAETAAWGFQRMD